jgi:hypothetical protein
VSVLSRFSLPDVDAVSRRTVFSSLAVGVVGLGACAALGDALTGLGFCIGISLGIFNFRMVQRSVAKVSVREGANHRRPLALNTLGRLAVVSVIALGLCFIRLDLGFGVLAGLAVFQLLLLVSVARSMYKMGAADLSGSVSLFGGPSEVPDALDDGAGG